MDATAWSSTWSRTSTRSSTSERTRRSPRPGAVLAGFVRLSHPFPSLLDGVVVAAVASIAGAEGRTALALGASMTALQASIGTLNDIVDAPADRDAKPRKPIPSGLVSPAAAKAMAVLAGGAGIVIGWSAGPFGGAVVPLAVLVLVIGYGYDLAFKGTAWSWLPFAVGIPLLPVYGWVGATGGIPASFAILVPVAVVGGAALAIANARADAGRDRETGVVSVATHLGDVWSWRIDATLSATVAVAALGTLVAGGADILPVAGAGVGSAIVAAGLAVGRSVDSGRRERAWQLQAVGTAVLAAAWLGGVTLAG
jgi:4-hydroxybenzoate polyprenyltransferase